MLNVTKTAYKQVFGDIKYFYLYIADECDVDLAYVLEEGCSIIKNVLGTGGVLLVHCKAGLSRSVTLVIAYLMKSLNMSLNDAFLHVKARRRKIRPNPGFLDQLCRLEIGLGREMSFNFEEYLTDDVKLQYPNYPYRDRLKQNPTKVLTSLYISDLSVANDRVLIENTRITDIIVLCHGDLTLLECIRYHYITEFSESGFSEVFGLIKDISEQGRKVLVCCETGVSDSVVVAIGYLLAVNKMSLNSSYVFVKNRRERFNPSLLLMQKLCELEVSLGKPLSFNMSEYQLHPA